MTRPVGQRREWTPIEDLLLDARLLPLDKDKNPRALRCLFCSRVFRFEDEVTRHIWSKHRLDILRTVAELKIENTELKEAVKVYRNLARERTQEGKR